MHIQIPQSFFKHRQGSFILSSFEFSVKTTPHKQHNESRSSSVLAPPVVRDADVDRAPLT